MQKKINIKTFFLFRAVIIQYSNRSTPLLSVSDVLALPDGSDEKEARVNFDTPVKYTQLIFSHKLFIKKDFTTKVAVDDVDTGFTGDVFEVEGSLNIGSQHHFYMETHSTLVRPAEEGQFEVVSSTQHMDGCQVCSTIINC